MSKTIYITDKDALDVDRVVVNSPDLKGCKIFISCDVCEVLKKLQENGDRSCDLVQ